MSDLTREEIDATIERAANDRSYYDWTPERAAKALETEAYLKDGAYRWISSDNVVPLAIQIMGGASYQRLRWAVIAQDKDLDVIVAAMRKAEAEATSEQRAERLAEMRAAFGPGASVINVLTGTVVRT